MLINAKDAREQFNNYGIVEKFNDQIQKTIEKGQTTFEFSGRYFGDTQEHNTTCRIRNFINELKANGYKCERKRENGLVVGIIVSF
jgi:hypothetical protein